MVKEMVINISAFKRATVIKGRTVALEVAVVLVLGSEQLPWCIECLMNAPEQM